MNSKISPEDANPRLLRHLERHQKQKQRQVVLFRVFLIVSLIAILAKVDISQIFGEVKQATAILTRMSPAAMNSPNSTNCDATTPPNGSTYMFDPSAIRRSDVVYSGLNLNNQHNFPVELLIGSSDRQTNYQAVFILPQGSAEVSLPIGSYSLTLLVGEVWCNVNDGFSDGHRVVVNNLIDIFSGKTNQLRFESVGPKDTDVHLVSTQVDLQGPTQATQQAPDSAFVPSNPGNGNIIELRRQANGGFYINGTVNHVPIIFQIDTWASITSIPKEIASSAGIYACDGRMFDTANGQAFGCLAIAKELTFGNNRMEGFQVASMPGLKTGLLGMNILRHFKIENVGDVMRISSAEAIAAPPTQYVPAPRQPEPVVSVPQPVAQPDEANIMANRKEACEKTYDTDKRYINARMRQGYSAQEGEYFRERLRQIEQSYHECLAETV